MLRKDKMTTASGKEATTTIYRITEPETQHKNVNECRCWFGCHHRRHRLCRTPLYSLLSGNKLFSADEQWAIETKNVFHRKKDFQG